MDVSKGNDTQGWIACDGGTFCPQCAPRRSRFLHHEFYLDLGTCCFDCGTYWYEFPRDFETFLAWASSEHMPSEPLHQRVIKEFWSRVKIPPTTPMPIWRSDPNDLDSEQYCYCEKHPVPVSFETYPANIGEKCAVVGCDSVYFHLPRDADEMTDWLWKTDHYPQTKADIEHVARKLWALQVGP